MYDKIFKEKFFNSYLEMYCSVFWHCQKIRWDARIKISNNFNMLCKSAKFLELHESKKNSFEIEFNVSLKLGKLEHIIGRSKNKANNNTPL